jgi:hypothetical protein
MIRKEAETANKAALTQAQREGFRLESYLKPQIAVLDPALEKAALIAKNAEFEGKIVAQADELLKLREAVEKLLNK